MGVWLNLARVSRVSKAVKKLAAQQRRQRRELLQEELQQAWKQRDLALAWRLVTMVAGCKKRPQG
eukprot:11185463-Lingulodinium_polyedra.AAC.1